MTEETQAYGNRSGATPEGRHEASGTATVLESPERAGEGDRRSPAPESWVELVRSLAGHRPEDVAFTFLSGREAEANNLTYGALDRAARTIAVHLRAVTQPGDRVALLMPQGLDYLYAFFGCLYAGVVAVTAYPPRGARQVPRVRSIVEDSGAAVALVTAEVHDSCREAVAGDPVFKGLHWVVADRLDDDPELWQATPEATADGLAFLQYTSGSTSAPKGVMVSHGNLLHNTESIVRATGATDDWVSVIWLPLFHDMGLIGGPLTALRGGFRCVLMAPETFLRRPVRWLQALSQYGGRLSGGPNFAYELCVEKVRDRDLDGLDLSRWDVAFNGAEPIRPETLRRFTERFGPHGFRGDRFFPCYGLAEATLMVSGGPSENAPMTRRVDAVGLERGAVRAAPEGPECRTLVGSARPVRETDVTIVDPETGVARSADEIGEIWVSGPGVAGGYWNRPEESEETFRARVSGREGRRYLRTGDLGFVADGELFVTGRLKDLIIVRGRNLYPQDLERTAEESHPAARSGGAAAFGVEADGEERVVVVQEVDGTGSELTREVIASIQRAVTEEYEVQVHAVALIRPRTLPKTSSGKVRRRPCRAAWTAGKLAVVAETVTAEAAPPPGAPAEAPAPEALLAAAPGERRSLVERYLRVHLAALFRCAPEEIDAEEPLTTMGLDSLRALDLVNRVELDLGIELPPARLLESPTLREIAGEIATRIDDNSSLPGEPARIEQEIEGLSEAELDERLRALLAEEER